MPVLLVVVAYLLGTLPSAVWIASANGVDIAQFGSGNPGASNVTRALGWRKGIWVYVLDAAKGAAAAGLGLWLDGRPIAYACGAAAILGHMFPVFRQFRGGKGVATGSGVLVVLHPVLAPVSVVMWWVLSKVTGKAALGSIVVVALIPVGLFLFETPGWEFVAVGILCALILLKHATNVMRLIRREEHSLRNGHG
ncbi:MAG: glycerol-3-phosphate 1-O-acyltransferase PlsY [Actinomycetota bacterium]